MTETTEKPRRPILRPALVVIASLVALPVSGGIYGATGWVWLGGLNLALLIAGGLAAAWLLAVLVVLAAGTIVGRSRR